jgi:hypothetical protein
VIIKIDVENDTYAVDDEVIREIVEKVQGVIGLRHADEDYVKNKCVDFAMDCADWEYELLTYELTVMIADEVAYNAPVDELATQDVDGNCTGDGFCELCITSPPFDYDDYYNGDIPAPESRCEETYWRRVGFWSVLFLLSEAAEETFWKNRKMLIIGGLL